MAFDGLFAAAVVAADIPDIDYSGVSNQCRGRCLDITLALQNFTGVPASEIEATILSRSESNDPFTPVVIKDNLKIGRAHV